MGKQIRVCLRLINFSLTRLADALGVSHDTAKGWSAGRTDPSPENRQALAKFMRQHAKKLLATADELEE
jgi:transcriptional regulator with XRE-family HTH domain